MKRVLGAAAALIFLAACTGGGSDVRTLRIETASGECEPESLEADPGQRVRIVLENRDDVAYTLTDPVGVVGDLAAEPGAEAEVFAELPEGSATYALRCSADGGVQTEIRLVVGASEDATAAPTVEAGEGTLVAGATLLPDEPDATIAVSLADYTVSLSEASVREGRVVLIATNVSQTTAHELNVMQLQPDGSFENQANIAPMAPQQGGSVLVNLRPGTYRIACLIEVGEEGGTVDHYQQGMWVDLMVGPR